MPGIKFALGENPKDIVLGQSTGPRRYPTTRAGVEYVIRDAFTRAKAYQKEWQAYEKAKATTPDAVRAAARPAARAARRDPGRQAPRARAQLSLRRDPDDAARRRGVRLQDRHASSTCSRATRSPRRSPRTAPAPPRSRTGGATRSRRTTRSPTTPRSCHKKGVLVSINSDSAEHARRLNTEAAKSMRWGGLTEDEALALVTINPGETAPHRQPRRLARNRQGRRRRCLDAPSAQRLRDRRPDLHRRHALLRPRDRRHSGSPSCAKEKEALMAAERGAAAPTTSSSQDDAELAGQTESAAAERAATSTRGTTVTPSPRRPHDVEQR